MNTNIYLDVDGVLLTKTDELAIDAASFLERLISNKNNTCYWLTTRCKGDPTAVLNVLQPLLDKKTALLLEGVKPTTWRTLKTEAIDFTEPFRWFDDQPMSYEKNLLEGKGLRDSLILIDLINNPKQLSNIL